MDPPSRHDLLVNAVVLALLDLFGDASVPPQQLRHDLIVLEAFTRTLIRLFDKEGGGS